MRISCLSGRALRDGMKLQAVGEAFYQQFLTKCCRRDHAAIIAEDKELPDIFTKWCYMEWADNNWRDCYSDEHYLGTLLASKVQHLLPSLVWHAIPL